MFEGERPIGAELWKAPEKKQMDVREAIAIHKETLEHEMREDFGIPEVPKQILSEMEHVMRVLSAHVREKGYVDEYDDAVGEQLRILAVKISHFKEDPKQIEVMSLPEEGYAVRYKDATGQQRESIMNEDEQDLLFQLEMWADQFNGLKNVDAFQSTLKTFKERAQSKPESQRTPFLLKEMQKKYEAHGFTPEQIENLLVISEQKEIPELVPEGEIPGMQKIKIMREVWDAYLSAEEKSRYVKLAAGLTVAGAVEGIGPALLGMSMDSPTAKMASLFALSYFGMQSASGWVKRHLAVEFDQLMNDVAEKGEGLNQRLARDLVFQPGEKMARGEDRGRFMATLQRSQASFRDILSSVARTSAPAIASTTVGLGMMMASDWRLGLAALASAPIALAISRRQERRLGPLIDKTHETEAEIAQEVEEQISAHQDIVLSGMRETMSDRLEVLAQQQGELSHDRLKARMDMQFQSGYVLNAGVLAAMTAGGVALKEMGIGNTGDIVSALVYVGHFRSSFDQIIYTNNNLLESLGAIVQMEEVFNGYADAEVEADEKRIGVSEVKDFSLEIDGVSLAVDDERIIDAVSFTVPAGGVVRLEGKSGHGKTTMTRLMSGYYQPTEGAVRIGGHDVKDIKKTGPDSLYTRLAYLSQHPYIFDSGSVKENLAFGNPGASEDQMRSILEELNLSDRFSKSGSIDLSQKPHGLSGGEKARLGLARALLKIRAQENGGMIFLDQATEELDVETEAEVAQILLEEKRKRPNTTFVIISHREEFIRALEEPKDEKEGLSIQRVRLEKGRVKLADV